MGTDDPTVGSPLGCRRDKHLPANQDSQYERYKKKTKTFLSLARINDAKEYSFTQISLRLSL
jgi:hypothetical protein